MEVLSVFVITKKKKTIKSTFLPKIWDLLFAHVGRNIVHKQLESVVVLKNIIGYFRFKEECFYLLLITPFWDVSVVYAWKNFMH